MFEVYFILYDIYNNILFGFVSANKFLTFYCPIDDGNAWIPMDKYESLGEYMKDLRKFPPLLPNQQEYPEVLKLLLDDENILDLDVYVDQQILDEIVNNCLNENGKVGSRFSVGRGNK